MFNLIWGSPIVLLNIWYLIWLFRFIIGYSNCNTSRYKVLFNNRCYLLTNIPYLLHQQYLLTDLKSYLKDSYLSEILVYQRYPLTDMTSDIQELILVPEIYPCQEYPLVDQP